MATIKKAQSGDRITSRQKKRLGRISEKNPERAREVAERMKLRATRKKRGSELYDSLSPKEDLPAFKARTLEEAKKAKNGKSFPDLNKDGKITKADILKGRGVIAQKGAAIKIKKTQVGNTNPQATDSSSLGGYRSSRVIKRDVLPASKPGGSKKVLMKKGGKIKKAQAGLKASNKRVGPVDPKGAWTKVQEMTIAGKKTPVSLKKDKQLGATKMKSGGKMKKKK
jgi:hypothetical protein